MRERNKMIIGLILLSMLYGKEYPKEECQPISFIILLKNPAIIEELSLSKEQEEKIKNIYFNNEKIAEEVKSKIKIKEIELREILSEENPDPKKVENKIKEIGELNTELRIIRIKNFFQIKETLTQEQWKKFKEIILQRPFLKEKIKRHFKD